MDWDSNVVTALATGLLAFIGVAQIGILVAQRRQSQLELIEQYRRRWYETRKDWGAIIFLGRDDGDYYQVVDAGTIKKFVVERDDASPYGPTIWALDAARAVFTSLSDIGTRILQGQLHIRDVYPIFGTELLRHSYPLRALLDNGYVEQRASAAHLKVRTEIQDWLVYHDGIRRRCLILIDLLWAEAARLEDLPPLDLQHAADAKARTGKQNKRRLWVECVRLNGIRGLYLASRLARSLRHAEYRRLGSRIGIDKERLQSLDEEWTKRLLNRLLK
ncbi:hypothetical protein hmeg3_09670 [Herbaspirillum sp. meg3]|nr:hypothetical protein hmeg3_09670 [Herbaspirillum sp. meg3]